MCVSVSVSLPVQIARHQDGRLSFNELMSALRALDIDSASSEWRNTRHAYARTCTQVANSLLLCTHHACSGLLEICVFSASALHARRWWCLHRPHRQWVNGRLTLPYHHCHVSCVGFQ